MLSEFSIHRLAYRLFKALAHHQDTNSVPFLQQHCFQSVLHNKEPSSKVQFKVRILPFKVFPKYQIDTLG